MPWNKMATVKRKKQRNRPTYKDRESEKYENIEKRREETGNWSVSEKGKRFKGVDEQKEGSLQRSI